MAGRKAYTVHTIPAAHRAAGNVALAVVNGDSLSSNAFSVAANPSGSSNDPVTHYFGGMGTTETWESTVSNLAEAMASPVGGWPANGVTEAEAIAAAEAIHLQITITQDGSEPDPSATLANAMAALGIKQVVYEI
jgi:hypothetical protein